MPASRRDGLSSVLGLLTFLAGVGLIALTFSQAWEIFSKAPQYNLGLQDIKEFNLGVLAVNLSRLIVRILLLVVMAGIGSALANRGVRMYASVSSTKIVKAETENAENQS